MARTRQTIGGVLGRRGMSLVELLVILFIIGLITAITIPAVKPALDGRELREAARMVGTMLGSAQTRAISTGRPCGVWFERLTTAPDASLLMYLAETPPPYSGNTLDAKCRVQAGQITGFEAGGAPGDTGWQGMVHNNDLIQFNNQGAIYRIIASGPNVDPTTNLIVGNPPWSLTPLGPPATVPNYSRAVPYQIIRQPVRSSSPPMQLPGSAAVDLAWSGYAALAFRDAPLYPEMARHPVLVMFSKTGTMEGIYHSGGQFEPASGALYLLVGKREKLVNIGAGSYGSYTYATGDNAETKLTKHNWVDTNNFWLSVNYQTGLVSTGKVANPNNEASGLPANLQASRAYARDAQSVGGQ